MKTWTLGSWESVILAVSLDLILDVCFLMKRSVEIVSS